VGVWNEGLASSGSRVMTARRRWVAEHEGAFAERYAEIAGGQIGILGYEPSFLLPEGDPDASRVADAFRTELERVAEREQRRGMTLVGPHRDDLRFSLETEAGPLDLRTYGSGGQQRTAAIALRMVEADTIRASRERDPVILLDDAFAELDGERSARILAWIERQPGQVILTSPKASDVEVRGGALPRWTIRDGEILPE
jgi:DNA replication and repair protein RecF